MDLRERMKCCQLALDRVVDAPIYSKATEIQVFASIVVGALVEMAEEIEDLKGATWGE